MAAMESFARLAARAAGLSNREITIRFVGVRRMTDLNRRFLGRRYATDVLAFGSGESAEREGYAGDIAICPAVAAKNSRCLARELKILVLHGILHLRGYDHESDEGEMHRLELKLRRRLGLQ
ncbi:MAG: rRNA maturation RNase YbeY [Acidobacteria bacterium]|nr:rRNA maturation RNase YbeY [Acidobacteriota bacterium]